MALDIQGAARALAEARRTATPLAALPEAGRPANAEDGYKVQAAFIGLWPDRVAGWKAGATLAAVQERFKLTEPFLGPIFAGAVMQSPGTVKATQFNLGAPGPEGKLTVGVEVEFAFRLGRDLAPKIGGRSEAEVLDAVDALVPAIELITTRFSAMPFGDPGAALADCGLNGGIVLGQAIGDWQSLDLAAHATRLLVDGKVEVEGTGALVLGNPRKSLVWLVNNVGRLGHTLAKGHVLTTGSMTGIFQVRQGAEAVGDFGRLGEVRVRFS
jgi:2-keto-4-pentenoate hydratase